MQPVKAMVLAAGKGTRLGIIGKAVPKVLLPIGGTPIIEHTFSWLKKHGVDQVALNVNHNGEQIINWIGDGARFGMQVSYSYEDTLMGTAGGVKKMEHFFDGTFAVVYGDILVDFDLAEMVRFHKEKNAAATLALFQAPDPREVGIVETDEEGRIFNFIEKPKSLPSAPCLANAAVYILEKEVFSLIPCDEFCDFGFHVFPKLLQAGLPLYGYALKSEEYFMDIGTPEKYLQANRDMEAGRLKRSLDITIV